MDMRWYISNTKPSAGHTARPPETPVLLWPLPAMTRPNCRPSLFTLQRCSRRPWPWRHLSQPVNPELGVKKGQVVKGGAEQGRRRLPIEVRTAIRAGTSSWKERKALPLCFWNCILSDGNSQFLKPTPPGLRLQPFKWVISFNHNPIILSSAPFYSWEHEGTNRQRDLPKVTWLIISSGSRIQI